MGSASRAELPALIDGEPARLAAEALAANCDNIYQAFVSRASTNPTAPFLIIPARDQRSYHPDGCEIGYAEALEAIDYRAQLLQDAGYQPGHRIALMLDNQPEHFFTQLAIYKLGATQVPVNPDYLDHELAYLLEHSEVDLAIGLEHNLEQLSRVAGPTGVPVISGARLDNLPHAKTPVRNAPTGRTAEAAIIYTSGTTGRPKGCVLDQEFHFAAGLAYASLGGRLALQHGGDRIYVPLPVFHVNAGINTLCALILTGNCMILPDRFHPDSWWQDIVSTRATAMHYLGIIPPILLKREACAQESLHQLRFGLGAGIDPQLHAPFEQRFRVAMIEVWGMTETGRFIGDCHEPRRIDTRAFGKCTGVLQARVVDDNNTVVATGDRGELLVRARGDNPRQGFFREYLKDPQATGLAWQGGWFHTGDVVTQEPDGMLHFVERRKNIIRRSGENISAAEVENALIDHPLIDAVAVIGVIDELRDEEVMACVVAKPQATISEDTAREIFEHGQKLLTYYKLPGWLAFVGELPRTGTQKVQKGLIFPDIDDPRSLAFDLRSRKKKRA